MLFIYLPNTCYDTAKDTQKDMLGFIGFIVAAVVVGAFAVTAYDAYKVLDEQRRQAFVSGFYLLAMTMVVWASVAVTTDQQVGKLLMVAGDALLLLATGYMAYLLLARIWQPWFIGPLAVIGAGLLAMRAYVYAPQAYVSDGLLYFNVNPGVKVVIISLFALVWLPAVMLVARRVAGSIAGLQNGMIVIFISLVASMAVLISAQKPVTIIGSFTVVIVLFCCATILNVALARISHMTRSGHAARPPRQK